jgi:hypothetical protein
MKGKIFTLLFALPFFGVGVWMAYSISTNLIDAAKMRQWEPTQASLQRAGYERHSGDDADTYEAYAQYTYDFGGQRYTGTRVAIAGGADNIGDYQTDLGNRLSQIMSRGETVTVYVNRDNPMMAIVDRSVRWGLIGFKSIFLFVFGGVGLGLIIFVLRSPKEKDLSAPEFREKPWLANDDWQSALIRSSSKSAMYFAWGFAAFWNLISSFLPFVIYEEVTAKGNMAALIGLLFPLVGIGLLTWAVRRTLEWKRFGAAPVELDPFPGSIGGHVGGTIDINLPYDSTAQFSLTLTSLHSYVSGTGKNRSRKESAKWQDTQVAHMTSGPKGSRLSFRFEVPEDLSESAADKREDAYDLWRLNVKADLEGADFDRDYEIPVYATGEQSRHLSEFSIRQAKTQQREKDAGAIEKLINLTHDVTGKSMIFPMGRNLASGFGGMLFGGIFAGAGWFLIASEGQWFMGAIFGGVGSLILVSGLYFIFNSLEVEQVGSDIRTTRRILGIPVKQKIMRRADFVRFKKKASSTTQSGSKHVIRYSVSAVDRNGQKLVMGEGFKGAGQAEAAALFIGEQFGLREQRLAETSQSTIEDDNFLTAN